MAEATQYKFSHRELVEVLIKKQDLHEGIWGLAAELTFAAANAGPTEDQLLPSAIVGVKSLGLQRFEKETSLSVDAAKVNPKPPESSRS